LFVRDFANQPVGDRRYDHGFSGRHGAVGLQLDGDQQRHVVVDRYVWRVR
jgi:hypothetical protein